MYIITDDDCKNYVIIYFDRLEPLIRHFSGHIKYSVFIFAHRELITNAIIDIGSSLNVFDNPLLTTLSLPALQTVKDSFFICSNNAAFDVPANLPAIWFGATCAVVSGDGDCISTPVACPGRR
jgi:hypothetical protein